MKTKVRVIRTGESQSRLSVGDEGYIDSYMLGNHNRPLAIVVSGETIDCCYLWELAVITDEQVKQQHK